MEGTYIARWQTSCNAVAFLICVGEKLFVKEKFYDGFRGISGELLFLNIEIPENLKAEISLRGSWNEPMSDELKKFVDDIKQALAE